MGPEIALAAVRAAVTQAEEAARHLAAAVPTDWQGPAAVQYAERRRELLARWQEVLTELNAAVRTVEQFVAEASTWGTVL